MKRVILIIHLITGSLNLGQAQDKSRLGISHEIGVTYLFSEWDDSKCFTYSPGLIFRIKNDFAISAKVHFTIGGSWLMNEFNELGRVIRVTDTPLMFGINWGAGTSHFSTRNFGVYSYVGRGNFTAQVYEYVNGNKHWEERATITNICWETGVNIHGAGSLGIYLVPSKSKYEPLVGFTLRFGPFFIKEIIEKNKE